MNTNVKTENLFVQNNSKKIEKLMYDLEEYEMKGSYGGSLNLKEIRLTIKVMMMEIRRQNDIISNLQKQLKEVPSS